jgi:hypothetical protein
MHFIIGKNTHTHTQNSSLLTIAKRSMGAIEAFDLFSGRTTKI